MEKNKSPDFDVLANACLDLSESWDSLHREIIACGDKKERGRMIYEIDTLIHVILGAMKLKRLS